MKVYFHFSPSVFANSYLIGNEQTKEALIIDPCKITYKIIDQIETNGFDLKAVLITCSHDRSNENGTKTILKIYPSAVYAENSDIDGIKTQTLKGDGIIDAAGFKIKYFSIQGHAVIFQIENIIFSGEALSAGMIQKMPGLYALKNLKTNLQNKIMAQADETIIMPAFGPPTSVRAEKQFNKFLIEDTESKKENFF